METRDAARKRLNTLRSELTAQLHQVERELEQLDVTVVVSQWWQAPSGAQGRGTVFHKRGHDRCRPTNKPDEISLYEALRADLSACSRCRPRPT